MCNSFVNKSYHSYGHGLTGVYDYELSVRQYSVIHEKYNCLLFQ